MTEIPQSLVELHTSGKPREVATGFLQHYQADLEQALNYDQISQPRQGVMTYDSFAASINLEVSTNGRLAEAMMGNPASFMKSVMLAAQCKLLVGGAFDLFYLIPRWNGREKRLEVTPLIGYKGLCDMSQRHPRVHKVDAVLVFEGEEFEYDAGAGKLTHKVNLMGERSEEKMIGGYARVVITEPASTHPVLDDPVIHPMSRYQLLAIKHRSDAYKQAEKSPKWGGDPLRNSAWHTDPLPMHRKTLLRAVLSGGSVPKDMGIGAAISADDQAQVTVEAPKPTMPKVTRTEGIEATLGLSEEEGEPFEFAEEAAAALDQVQTLDEANSLKHRFQHFEAGDADVIAKAWANMESRLQED